MAASSPRWTGIGIYFSGDMLLEFCGPSEKLGVPLGWHRSPVTASVISAGISLKMHGVLLVESLWDIMKWYSRQE